jgi:hypothetical protein
VAPVTQPAENGAGRLSSGTAVLVTAIVASVALIVTYLALGGASY